MFVKKWFEWIQYKIKSLMGRAWWYKWKLLSTPQCLLLWSKIVKKLICLFLFVTLNCVGYASYFKISTTTDKKSRPVNYVFNFLWSEVFFFAQDGNIDENMLTVVYCFPQVTIAIPSLCCTNATLYTSKDGTNKMMFIKPKGPLEGGLLTLWPKGICTMLLKGI